MKVKYTIYIILFLCCCRIMAANHLPEDQEYDPLIESRIEKWGQHVKDESVSKTIYEMLLLIDSLKEEKYYYKEVLNGILGTIYLNLNQTDKSAKYFYEQLRVAKEHNYNYGMANAYFNLGINYLECDQYKRAEQFYQQAVYSLKQSGVKDNSFAIRIAIELSKSEFYQKVYWKAESRLLSLLTLKDSSASNGLNERLNIYIALSELYLGKNDIQRSLHFSGEAFKLRDSASVNLKILMLQNVRNILIKQRKWEEALEAAYEEEHFFKEIGMEGTSMNSMMKKAKILEALGKKEELLEVYKEMVSKKEKLKSPLMLGNVIGYEMDYEISQLKKQKETDLLLEKNEKRLFRLQAYLYLSLTLLLIILLLALVVWNRSRHKITNLKIEKEIDEKQLAYQKLQLNNASLTEFALHAERVQDKLSELKNRVTEALSASVDKEKLHQIKNEINLELQNPGLNPIELSNKVKSIKDELIFKLLRAHPTLTEKDRRLCILLMLNLSSKEMANILNIQEESVEKSRSRLRKKMNLSSTQNFIEYFNSIK